MKTVIAAPMYETRLATASASSNIRATCCLFREYSRSPTQMLDRAIKVVQTAMSSSFVWFNMME